jgi:hypothetical protein
MATNTAMMIQTKTRSRGLIRMDLHGAISSFYPSEGLAAYSVRGTGLNEGMDRNCNCESQYCSRDN